MFLTKILTYSLDYVQCFDGSETINKVAKIDVSTLL